jgi:hypothetical protein
MAIPNSGTFRVLLRWSLMTATLGVILWSAWLFRPQRDETIRAALKNQSRPAIWWPPSWRAEYGAVAPFLSGLQSGEFKALTDEEIATFKSFGGGRNAFWGMAQTLREQDGFSRDITLVFLCHCHFDYQGWDQEICEFLAVLAEIPDEEYPLDHAGYLLLQIAPFSKDTVPQLVRALELAFTKKAELDAQRGSILYFGPSPAQPVYVFASALARVGPDAKEAVPLLAEILAHERRQPWPDSVFVDRYNDWRPLLDVIYESLLLIDPTAAKLAAE